MKHVRVPTADLIHIDDILYTIRDDYENLNGEDAEDLLEDLRNILDKYIERAREREELDAIVKSQALSWL